MLKIWCVYLFYIMILVKFFLFIISEIWKNFVVFVFLLVKEMIFFIVFFFISFEVFEFFLLLVICLVLFILILVFNMVGNIFVCVVVWKMCKLWSFRNYYYGLFLMSLVIVDMVVGFVCMFFILFYYEIGKYLFGFFGFIVVCKFILVLSLLC